MALKGVGVGDRMGVPLGRWPSLPAMMDMRWMQRQGIDKQGKMSYILEQVFIHHSVHSPGFCEDFVGAWGALFSQEDKVKAVCGHLSLRPGVGH